MLFASHGGHSRHEPSYGCENMVIQQTLIGAGLAGGDWKVISKIISEELQGEDYTLVEFAP